MLSALIFVSTVSSLTMSSSISFQPKSPLLATPEDLLLFDFSDWMTSSTWLYLVRSDRLISDLVMSDF